MAWKTNGRANGTRALESKARANVQTPAMRARIVDMYRDTRMSQHDIARLTEVNISVVNSIIKADLSVEERKAIAHRNQSRCGSNQPVKKGPVITFDESFSRIFCSPWGASQ